MGNYCNIRLDAAKEDALERILDNLDKAKLKLDEAFFYLDEIEELIQEDELSETAGSKVTQATERLTTELSALSGKVAELREILQALDEQQDSPGDSG
jgi:polyhydroxyalkanoate synthesis regulator phasin